MPGVARRHSSLVVRLSTESRQAPARALFGRCCRDSLSAVQGTRLGRYEILEPLGAGGMGEVWLAEDTRLGRRVAVKVLPEGFASDPERLARFEQEARAAAALNHPHIAAVYDVGTETAEDGSTTRFMVQEFLRGRSLQEALEKRPLPLEKALTLGAEIIEALKAAHAAGIVHRDLKPENVFVTEDGHAKVLDFGLAKLTETTGAPAAGATMSPTALGTQAGAIMGTAGYMAPEQVNGEEVDHRADLFAFGCVLFEMVTGKQPFRGQNVYETLGKIVSSEPERLEVQGADIPPELRRLVRKCLAKDPARRAWSAGDLIVDLRMLASDLESGAVAPSPGASRESPAGMDAGPALLRPLVLAALAASLVLGGVATWLWVRAPETPARIVQFDIELPEGTNFRNLIPPEIAISPDGSTVVFVAGSQLWIRRLEEREARPLRNTQNAVDPFFSPDGREIGFAVNGQLKKVSVDGGPALDLGPVTGIAADGPHWAEDGYIYIAGEPEGITRRPGSGGEAEVVVESELGLDTGSPQLLPGGEWVIFTEPPAARRYDDASIVAGSIATGERRVILAGGRHAMFAPTGHLLWVRAGVLFGQPFDAEALELYGEPVALLEGVRTATANVDATAHYEFSDNGTLIYLHGETGVSSVTTPVWMDREGNETLLPFEPRPFINTRLSPDSTRLAAVILDETQGSQLWLYEVDRPRGQLFTSSEGENVAPVWSPDGGWIYFASSRGGGDLDIWRKRADLSGAAEIVAEMPHDQYPTSISADGTMLAFQERNSVTSWDIGVLSLQDGASEMLAHSLALERAPALSPDGRFVAYDSSESGTPEIYAMQIESRRRWLISTTGGNRPLWLPDGNEISFRTRDGARAIVRVAFDPDFTHSPPEILYEAERPTVATGHDSDVTFDGQRFLELPAIGDGVQGVSRIRVILGWFEELTARVPTGR